MHTNNHRIRPIFQFINAVIRISKTDGEISVVFPQVSKHSQPISPTMLPFQFIPGVVEGIASA